MGSSPKDILEIITKNIHVSDQTRVLDLYHTRDQWCLIFNCTGTSLIDEIIIEDDELASLNNEQQEYILKRANELKEKLPGKAHLFDRYIHSQE